MTLAHILGLGAIAVVLGRLRRGRSLALLTISALIVFWLQPETPFVTLRFWLPFATLGMTVLTWALTATPEARGWRRNGAAGLVLVGVPLLVDSNRYFKLEAFFATGAPLPHLIAAALLGIMGGAWLLMRWPNRLWSAIALWLTILIFLLLKTPALSEAVLRYAATLRGTSGKVGSLSWLGFSYVAFRLMHTIRDHQSGRLPPLMLDEYVNYVIFFPSLTAGPIDRAERFLSELRHPLPLQSQDWLEAGGRLLTGLFKKFVLADLLAVLSLNDTLVRHVQSAGWLWLFLYAYTLRIYFDFSGYTDMAIGLGRLMGIRLPENFASPYLKANLTQFWNAWHMTLTQWFRAYYFNPLTRALRSRQPAVPAWLIILITQLSTMVLIGLWHGVAWGYALWGLWHGVGLFVQNRWSELARRRLPPVLQGRMIRAGVHLLGVFVTFHFVALGWLFFNLSSPTLAWQALLKLFGLL